MRKWLPYKQWVQTPAGRAHKQAKKVAMQEEAKRLEGERYEARLAGVCVSCRARTTFEGNVSLGRVNAAMCRDCYGDRR